MGNEPADEYVRLEEEKDDPWKHRPRPFRPRPRTFRDALFLSRQREPQLGFETARQKRLRDPHKLTSQQMGLVRQDLKRREWLESLGLSEAELSRLTRKPPEAPIEYDEDPVKSDPLDEFLLHPDCLDPDSVPEDETMPSPRALSDDELSRIFTINDPRHHSASDINFFYEIAKDGRDKIFPEGLAGKFGKIFSEIDEKNIRGKRNDVQGLLVRPSSIDLIGAIAANLPDADKALLPAVCVAPPGYAAQSVILIDGPRGCGKSGLLNHAVHWARSAGFLVVFVPSAWKWLDGNGFSERYPGDISRIHQPDYAMHFCATFAANDNERLDKIAIVGGPKLDLVYKYTHARAKSLSELARIGSEMREAATFVAELLLESVIAGAGTQPVLFAIDEANAFFGDSLYKVDFKPVRSDNVVMGAHFKRLVTKGMKNGLVVAATSYGNVSYHDRHHPKIVPWRRDLKKAGRITTRPKFEEADAKADTDAAKPSVPLESGQRIKQTGQRPPDARHSIRRGAASRYYLIPVPKSISLEETQQYFKYMEVNGLTSSTSLAANADENNDDQDYAFMKLLSGNNFKGLHDVILGIS